MNLSFFVRCAIPLVITASLIATANSQTTPTTNWAQFRGSNGSGVADTAAIPPTKWDFDKQTAWKVDIPGTGWSSPVYEGENVWLTSAVTEKASPAEIAERLKGDRLAKTKTVAASIEIHAICVDINSGKVVHDIALGKIDDPQPINPMNSYASPTPAIRDGKVVCHFGNYGTWCLDEESGDILWNRQFVVEHSVGPGSSPVIFGDKVILVCDGTDVQFVVGLNLTTGELAWKTDRPPFRTNNGEYRKAYCTPILIEIEGKQQAVIPGAQWVAGYDPDSGKELWRADHGDGFSVTPMPVYESGLIIFSTGFMRPELVAVNPVGSGDITSSGIVWRSRNGPRMSSLIARSGQIFAIEDNGILMCLDAKTGEVINRQRVGGNFSSSPILAGGNLYLSSREGIMTVVKCSSDLETIATNKFEGSIMASPVLIGNDLLIRTDKQLVRIKSSTP